MDDWEGKVNAWPLDEGLIDYVDPSYGGATDENEYAVLNVIANKKFTIAGQEVDATVITPALLSDTLQEADAVEANVATGYHAIEFCSGARIRTAPMPARATAPIPTTSRRELHGRQLRPPRRLSDCGDRPLAFRSRLDDGAMAGRVRGAQDASGR